MAIHDKFAALAERLIAKHGRDMSVRKLKATPGDAAKPWRGPDSASPAGYEYERTVKAVVVEYEEKAFLNEQIKRGDQRMLIACSAVPGLADLLTADYVQDGTQVWAVVKPSVLKPGTTAIIYDFQVRA